MLTPKYRQPSLLPEEAGILGDLTPQESRIAIAVLQSLTNDLRWKQYRDREDLAGYCYVVSESMYHMLGREDQGYSAWQMEWEGVSHWFLMGPRYGSKRVIDVTSSQFMEVPEYNLSKRRSFMHPSPSKRARILIERAEKLLSAEGVNNEG